MTSKTLNKIMLVAALLFCVIFGVSIYIKNERLKRLDDAHDQEWEDKRNQENQSNQDSIDQFDKNNQANNGNNSPTITDKNGQTVDFTNFVSLYGYAESKLNDATNIQSKATGEGKLSGKVSFGSNITLTNETINIQIERAQNSNQKWFRYTVKGNILDGLFNLDYTTETYTKGSQAWLYFNQESQDWSKTSVAGLNDRFGWSTNQTFQIINSSSVKPGSSVIYQQRSDDYKATAELDVSKSSSRAGKFIQGTYGATSPASYKSCKLTVRFDKTGNFKSIQYEETFDVVVYNKANNATINATVTTNYTETFTCIDKFTVPITQPPKINA
ncbi:MAG: hypothetical protein SPF07_04115 [Eubacteriales bacterium]|nr:hypothetical protein [Eubacteriales bacterium]